MSNKESAQGGIGFTSLLLVAFIVLKLRGVIAWSWIWVLGPFWIPLLLVLGPLIGCAAMHVLTISSGRNRRDRRVKTGNRRR